MKAKDWGSVTEAGFKVTYYSSDKGLYGRYRGIVDRSKKAVRENSDKLEGAKKAVEELVDKLLADGKISVHPAVGLTAEKVAERVKKAASEILSPEATRYIDPVKHQAYGRVYYPLIHLLINDVSEVEFAQFFTTAIFGDGSIYPRYVELTLGEFGSKRKKLPYDKFHKLALWLAVLEKYRPVFEKYGVDITPSVYVEEDAIRLRFVPKAAGLLFALGGGPVWQVYDEYVHEIGRNLWDRGFIKAERMLDLVVDAFEDVKVRWEIDESGEKPVLRVQFVREAKGEEAEIANLNVYVEETLTGNTLYAEFVSSREKAEALASILRAWGAEAEAKPKGRWWHVTLYSNQLFAVDHPEFKAALEAFIAKAKERGLLTEEQAEKKLAKISAGPNAVEIAGVELHVEPMWKDKRRRELKHVEIRYQTTDKGRFEKAVEALKAFGLVEGAGFTAEWREAGTGDIWLKAGAFEKAAEALRGAGLKEGEDFTVKRAKGGGGLIIVKKPRENLDKILDAFRKAGLVEGEDYTVHSEKGYIRLAMPEALWTIAWMAKHGDERAKEALGQLLEVAGRLGIRHYFEERIRPVLMAGTNNAVGKKVTVKGVTVEITGFKVEWVSFGDANKPCNWPAELCRPKVTVEYVHNGGEGGFVVTWNVGEKGAIYANVRVNTLDRAAALVAVGVQEGDKEEEDRIVKIAERGGVVTLTLDNLLAMAEYNKDLLEWAMRIRNR